MKKKIILSLRIFLGIVFIYASWDKILNPKTFAESVYNYQILPDSLINFTAIVLPWLELFLGICVIIGKWLPGSLFLINALLIIFMSALIFNAARGLNIECGCFSTEAQTVQKNSTLWFIIRDAIFLISSIFLFFQTYIENKILKAEI